MASAQADATVEYWNGPAGQRWAKEQEALDGALAAFGLAVLAKAGLRVGEVVVDVGCGCGALSLAAADAVGPSGAVVGVDISAPMLERALDRASARPQLSFVQADAASHRFERAADAIVSRFGVMFFPDPSAAFANLHAALGPGGRLAFVCWRALAENPWLTVPSEAAARHLRAEPPTPAGEPGPFSLADAARIASLLAAAHFDDIAITAHDAPVVLSTSGVEDAARFASIAGPTARMLNATEDVEAKQRALAAIAGALTPHLRDGTVSLPSAAWIVTALRG